MRSVLPPKLNQVATGLVEVLIQAIAILAILTRDTNLVAIMQAQGRVEILTQDKDPVGIIQVLGRLEIITQGVNLVEATIEADLITIVRVEETIMDTTQVVEFDHLILEEVIQVVLRLKVL